MREALPLPAPPKHLDASFHSHALELIRSAFPSKTIDTLKIERLSCAMTNEVYLCLLPSNEKILLRVYGKGTELFFERHRELATFRKLSEKGFGPKLIASFDAGRLEEWIDSHTLNKDQIRDPETMKEIAQEMHKLHNLFPEGSSEDCELWFGLDAWFEKAQVAIKSLHKDDLRELSLSQIRGEIDELRDFLANHTHAPVVFCHNDAQYGNILRKKANGALVLIDYEYAGYNYRGFDFGNHFCEWAANYDSPEPHKLDFSKYPTKDEQMIFFRAYLLYQHRKNDYPFNEFDLRHELEALYIESNQYGLASHLKWALWGIIQAAHSTIDFDYLEYARQRMREYLLKKPLFLAL